MYKVAASHFLGVSFPRLPVLYDKWSQMIEGSKVDVSHDIFSGEIYLKGKIYVLFNEIHSKCVIILIHMSFYPYISLLVYRTYVNILKIKLISVNMKFNSTV